MFTHSMLHLLLMLISAIIFIISCKSTESSKQHHSSSFLTSADFSDEQWTWWENGFIKFKHPGVLVTKNQLDYAKKKVQTGEQPWLGAFEAMANSNLASLNYEPNPRPIVECGSNSQPNFGCSDERTDALAAYTHALMWFFTDDELYAQKAIEIMDAWSAVLHGHNNTNALLQASWSAASFSRSGELIAHIFVEKNTRPKNNSSTRKWPNHGRFMRMLRNVFVPKIRDGIGCKNGNWELILADALIGCAVHLDDLATFGRAIQLWRQRLASYVYLSMDGRLPNRIVCSKRDEENCPAKDWIVCPKVAMANLTQTERNRRLITFWYNQTVFVDGITQETCRDFGHTGWGIHAASHVAETAWHQGVDLYEEMVERLVLTANFHSQFDVGAVPISQWLCGGTLKLGLGPVFEVLYNHYANRMLLTSLTTVATHLAKVRPTGADYFYAWETLTHAGNAK